MLPGLQIDKYSAVSTCIREKEPNVTLCWRLKKILLINSQNYRGLILLIIKSLSKRYSLVTDNCPCTHTLPITNNLEEWETLLFTSTRAIGTP